MNEISITFCEETTNFLESKLKEYRSKREEKEKVTILEEINKIVKNKPSLFMAIVSAAERRIDRLHQVARKLKNLGFESLAIGQIICIPVWSKKAEEVEIISIEDNGVIHVTNTVGRFSNLRKIDLAKK